MDLTSEEPEHGDGNLDEKNGCVAGLQERRRVRAREARGRERHLALAQRRFSSSDEDLNRLSVMKMPEILGDLARVKFNDFRLLERLKAVLASESEAAAAADGGAEAFFSTEQNLYSIVNVIAGSGNNSKTQLSAVQVVANLSPLSEKSGVKLARAAGPYLITLLSSASCGLREASAVALGNLALAGYKAVRVLVNQDVVERLNQSLEMPAEDVAPSLYALYHLLHVMGGTRSNSAVIKEEVVDKLTVKCLSLLEMERTKSPLEVFWVLFALSCVPRQHQFMADRVETLVQSLMEVCTYEIYQKSDPRPLVKVVTPVTRLLANLSAGPCSEILILNLIRHPDTVPILMALLGTNYHHLCKETLWLFANIVNSDSIAVQEEIVELDLMDKLEYHTLQAVQKLDPYAIQC